MRKRFWRKLRGLFERRRLEQDLDEEIRLHLELSGGDRASRIAFGNPTRVLEDAREVWSFGGVERVARDVRFAARMLRKNPGFTALAVATLALGIGASTSIFTLLNAIALRPYPVEKPGELVRFYRREAHGGRGNLLSAADYEYLRDHSRAYSGLLAYRGVAVAAPAGSEHDDGNIVAMVTTANYFRVLGREPRLGRGFLPEEENAAVVVIGHGYWRRRF